MADVIASVHFAFVAFLFAGLGLTVAGTLLDWQWSRGRAFVLAHTGAISFVVVRTWARVACPLTVAEAWFRSGSTDHTQSGWVGLLHAAVFAGAEPRGFAIGATAFLSIVAGAHALNAGVSGRVSREISRL
jgi:hypothetical protein